MSLIEKWKSLEGQRINEDSADLIGSRIDIIEADLRKVIDEVCVEQNYKTIHDTRSIREQLKQKIFGDEK